MAPLDLDPSEAWKVVSTLNDYLLGHALRVAHSSPEGFPGFESADYPRLASALATNKPARDQDTFGAGLEIVLAGIEHSARTR